MPTNFIPLLLVAAAIIASYYLIIFLAFRKKIASTAHSSRGKQWMQISQISTAASFPHQLIDRPVEQQDAASHLVHENNTYHNTKTMQIVEDEESVLLKAAEIVVEKVQDTVNHIASLPPNLEEVCSKIKSIVNQYHIFHNTEYFDAINSFIAITVERDCSIQLTKEQLLDLWK